MTRGDLLTDILMFAITGDFLRLWCSDCRQAKAGTPSYMPLPGASYCGVGLIVLSVLGALLLVGFETGGEYALNIVAEQHKIKVTFLASMLGAAIVEEIIFRGYLVIQGRGVLVLWISIIGFSLLFAIAHPYLWNYNKGDASFWELSKYEWSLQFNTKGFFSAGFVFLNSLWFYALRFMPANTERSLLPCFIAHGASNIAVFAVKAAQGYVEW